MSGIQISGLVSNSAFDWKSIVDQLIAADSIPVTTLKTQQTTNSSQITALDAIKTSLQALQDSVQSIRSGSIFSGRTVSSDTPNTTWQSSSVTGAAIGDYTIAVKTLATAATLNGKSDVGNGLSGNSTVSTMALSSLHLASPITAGTFSVNGQSVSVATTDSLQDVFNKITAADPNVTAKYDPNSDSVTMTDSGGTLTLGGGGDTSNFLTSMNLASSGTSTASSSTPLGTVASGLTVANLHLASPVTAGTFSVDGQQVSVATTDSLQDVFDKIHAADPQVTAKYDPSTDGVTLTNSGGELVLGAANDTSNFLSAMKLANNGTSSSSSSATLGTVQPLATLANSGLKSAITNVDGSGNGSFSINGVAISYNVNSDSLTSVLNRINASGAGVTASYDSANDRVSIVNKSTGDLGIGASETGNGLLNALGLTSGSGSAFTHGTNATFTINGGPLLSSTTNTLDSSVHGITGLSVTVNSKSTQTLSVQSDTASMQSAISDFVTKFNAVQDLITTDTQIQTAAGTVSTSVLSSNREVQDWASSLQSLAFGQVSGLTGTVKRLDDLGIDFNGTTGDLVVKDTGKLATALSNHPDDVQSYFTQPSNGLVTSIFGFLTNAMSSDTTQQDNLTQANTSLDTQISTLQSRLDDERTQLTNSFIAMLDAQSTANSQSTYLTNQFFKSSSTG